MKNLKKLTFILVAFVFALTTYTFAADDANFLLVVDPNPLKVGEASDLTVKVVDSNGDVITDWEGFMSVEVSGNYDEDIVEISEGGYFTIEADDMGELVFSKGLIFSQEGNFSLIAESFEDEPVTGELEVTVLGEGQEQEVIGTIDISYPTNGMIIKSDKIDISGTSSLPNTILEVYIDGIKEVDGMTDENGDFNITVSEISEGEHILRIKLIDISSEVLGISQDLSFETESMVSDLFDPKDFEILPSNTINEGENMIFMLNVSDVVSAADIIFNPGETYPLDIIGQGKFQKDIIMDQPGTFNVSLKLYADGQQFDYTDLQTINIVQKKGIGQVKTNVIDGTLQLDWDFVGEVAKFRINYGNNRDDLNNYVVLDMNKASLTGLDLESYVNYLQIFPLNINDVIDGTPSTIIEIDPTQKQGSATCKISGISLETEKIGDKYYLVWDKAEGVKEYIVYKSEEKTKSIDDMVEVGRTTENRFEYPFDEEAEKDIYAYYTLEAVCEDGNVLNIEDVKKVKVGPLNTILVVFLLTLFLYFGYKLYGTTNS